MASGCENLKKKAFSRQSKERNAEGLLPLEYKKEKKMETIVKITGYRSEREQLPSTPLIFSFSSGKKRRRRLITFSDEELKVIFGKERMRQV